MPTHTELERAKNRLDISRPIDSFPAGSLQKQRQKIKRKTLNFKANPRSRPSIGVSPSPKRPIIKPTGQPSDITGKARNTAELIKERNRLLKNF